MDSEYKSLIKENDYLKWEAKYRKVDVLCAKHFLKGAACGLFWGIVISYAVYLYFL